MSFFATIALLILQAGPAPLSPELRTPDSQEADRLLQSAMRMRIDAPDTSIQRARELAFKAIELFQKVGDPRGEGMAAEIIANTYIDQGKHRQAEQFARQMLTVAERASDAAFRARALNLVAITCMRQGRYEESFLLAREARSISARLRIRRHQARSAQILGQLCSTLGQDKTALVYLTEGLDLSCDIPNPRTEALIRMDLGHLHAKRGEHEKAIDHFQKALESDEGPLGPIVNLVLNGLSGSHCALGNHGEAEAYARRSLDSARRFDNPDLYYRAYVNLANVAFDRGDLENAESLYKKAANTRVRLSTDAFVGLGKIGEKRGDLKSAWQQYERAIRMFDAVIDARIAEEDRYTLFRQMIEPYQRSVGALVGLHASTNDPSYARLAFEANERIHNRIFAEHVAAAWHSSRRNPQSLDPELKALETRITRVSKKLFDGSVSPGDERGLRSAIERLELEQSSIRREIAIRDRLAGEVRKLEELPIEDIQKMLPVGAALLEYSFGDNPVVFLLSRSGMELVPLPRAERLAERIPAYMDMLSAPSASHSGTFERRASHGLYRDLLKPAIDRLPPGTVHLIISPVGMLEVLPFESLGTDVGGRFLIEDYSVSYLPSASLLPILGERRSTASARMLLAFADPVYTLRSDGSAVRDFFLSDDFSLTPIPYSRIEVEAVARTVGSNESDIFVGEQASERRLKSLDLERYRVLHFATHSIASPAHAERSALILALGSDPQEDGFLQVREILNLRLRADLVVLSACQTGRGSGIPGEGLQGLSRAFFFAGARSLLASLWKVPDQATALLMTRFYQYLAQGLSPAESVRRTKVDMIAGRHPPREWAGFVLLGDASRRVFPAPRRPDGIAADANLTTGGVLFAASLFVWIGRWSRKYGTTGSQRDSLNP